jgi:hypothetical protein
LARSPLIDATETTRVATESVRRALTYYDYLQTGDTALALRAIHETMIEQQQKLNAILLNHE